MARIKQFFQDVSVEMSKVAWPSKDELKGLTQVVLVTLLVLAAIVGVYDWVFLHVVKLLLLLG
ncbi:MAG: preprotein translocase subunit SecE [Candidatus Hydrogenedentes bacterium]|nr:preprotein translocase subunit SecE [Candidatus Hydrogenedentota bacterium]